MTLIELVVVLVILGITAGFAAFGGMQSSVPTDPSEARADSLRMLALVTGRAVIDTVGGRPALLLPDGRIIRDRTR
jgi:prepilin-type N-terminal cleavage/methylation domain-containing protein